MDRPVWSHEALSADRKSIVRQTIRHDRRVPSCRQRTIADRWAGQ
jgi:hypothetical protein